MAITIDTRSYREIEVLGSRIIYAAPSHTISFRDVLQLSRVDPKATKDSAGQARAEARSQMTAKSATGDILGVNTLSTSASFAVGTPDSEIDQLIDRHRDFVASPHFVALVKSGITKMEG